jgi:hypothetical protein
MDDGGMSIRLDPRRLGALKLLAAEAGIRPGELVTRWVEERLDAARAGGASVARPAPAELAALSARVDELARRLDRMTAPGAVTAESPAASAPEAAIAEAPVKRGRGRPRKVVEGAAPAPARAKRAGRRPASSGRSRGATRVSLHDEIAAVIAERGPLSASELASAISERGRYQPPRSAKPLDAATINARVSNPTYRSRFVRREHRIGIAE